MKKWWTFCLLILGLLVFPWLSLRPVQAAAGQQSFTALDATCSVIPGTQWISGNVLHVRGEVDIKQTSSSNPLVNGTNRVITNYDVNLSSGSGGGWGTFTLQPVGVNGSWSGSFSGPLSMGVFSGQGVATGTGDLANMRLQADFQGIPVPATQPCPSSASDADQIRGVILSLP